MRERMFSRFSLVQRYLTILFVLAGQGGPITCLNSLITTCGWVQWRMDKGIWNRLIEGAEVGVSGGRIWVVSEQWEFYNNPIWNFLDLAGGFYGITSLGKVGATSTYLKFGTICDILWYHCSGLSQNNGQISQICRVILNFSSLRKFGISFHNIIPFSS